VDILHIINGQIQAGQLDALERELEKKSSEFEAKVWRAILNAIVVNKNPAAFENIVVRFRGKLNASAGEEVCSEWNNAVVEGEQRQLEFHNDRVKYAN